MLIRSIEKFLREHDMPPTKFGRLAAHDPRLVLDMRNGRTPREEMAARVERFMRSYAQSAGTDQRAGREQREHAHHG